MIQKKIFLSFSIVMFFLSIQAQELEQKYAFHFQATGIHLNESSIHQLYRDQKNVAHIRFKEEENEVIIVAICKNFEEQNQIIKIIKDWIVENQGDIKTFRKENLSVKSSSAKKKKL